MSEPTSETEPAFHLILEADEAPVLAVALRLLIADEAHQPAIRDLARGVIPRLQAPPQPGEALSVPLSPQEMKITHTAPSGSRSTILNASKTRSVNSCGGSWTSSPTSTRFARSSWNRAELGAAS